MKRLFKWIEVGRIRGSFRLGVEYLPRYRELFIDLIWVSIDIKLK